MNILKFQLVFLLMLAGVFTACNDYLDAKPDKKLVVPSSLDDYQSLLDNQSRLNTRDPEEGEISSDDYTVSPEDWAALATETDKRLYIWEKDYLFSSQVNSWSYCYNTVYYANTVLENLDKMEVAAAQGDDYRNIKGQAFYFRGKSFLQAAFIWTPGYDQATAETDLGLPLRFTTDFNLPSERANLGQTYAAITGDLKDAAALLPVTPLHPMRPSKPAAFGLLARTYLAMRDYRNAGLYADSALQLYHTLLDYNTLDSNLAYPIARFNTEVIMESRIPISQILNSSRPKTDMALYRSYDANDLRRAMFFLRVNNQYTFKGSYEGEVSLFGGVAVDELYLTRAECFARAGEAGKAMDDLNALLAKRWKRGTFVPFSASDAGEALALILRERRKELLMRGLRWMDLKRLNKEGANIVLTRAVNGQVYTLLPNDPRYALPIPEDVISLSGMPQNPR